MKVLFFPFIKQKKKNFRYLCYKKKKKKKKKKSYPPRGKIILCDALIHRPITTFWIPQKYETHQIRKESYIILSYTIRFIEDCLLIDISDKSNSTALSFENSLPQ